MNEKKLTEQDILKAEYVKVAIGNSVKVSTEQADAMVKLAELLSIKK